MRRLLLSILLLAIFPCAMAAEAKRVLIIGNSYTFYNNLPDSLEALSKKTAYPLEVDSYTAGAMSLHGFLTMPQHAKARQLVESGRYDWVVLQDQSQTPAYKPEESLSAVQQWADIATQHDTRVMLFLTWAHASRQGNRYQPMQDMQERTSATYCRAALAGKTRVAPVGEAWAAWYRKNPDKPLHGKDGSHPNDMGSYLAACVLHAAITGKAIKGAPATLRKGGKTLISIPAASARELQKTANATLKSFTPENFLKKLEERDVARPSAGDIKQQLSRNMHIRELIGITGKPVLVTSQGNRKTYQFQLRGGSELCAYCNATGIVQQISIATPGLMADIIDLSRPLAN